MRDWSLAPGDPLYLTLAADSRLSNTDYLNDHIWEITIGGGEPSALSLRTTYGLRAKAMRIFPRFGENGKSLSDPSEFAARPVLRRFYPNFLIIDYSPLPNLDVSSEYWIPSSNSVCGRISLTNKTNSVRKIRLELCASLSPIDGQSISVKTIQMVSVLTGKTGGLFPVIFMTGGPNPGKGPNSALLLELELGPGATRQFTWAEAALESAEASFELARQTAARQWEAERARIEMLNMNQSVDIHTGDKEWDAALMFSQSVGHSLLLRPNTNLLHTTFVSVRQPDNGHSPKGDGDDYPASWNGQTPLESYYLANVLPMSNTSEQLLRNFLSIQDENGSIDGKPGLAGQRGRYLAAPMLASLAWKIYESNENTEFIREVFPYLLKYLQAWFSTEIDEDGDGLPQWKHILQTGFDNNPLFDSWNDWSLGVNITQVHSPSLEAMLYNEAACLIKMAELIEQNDSLTLLHEHASQLRKSIESTWQPRTGLYHYRDRETESNLAGKELAKQTGPGTLITKLKFETPTRLLVEVHTQSPTAKRPEIHIHQFSTKPADELVSSGDYQWRNNGLVYTTRNVYPKLAKVVVKDLDKNDTVIIRTLDFTSEDITLLTPLWAGVPDQSRAEIMIGRALLDVNRFHRPYGAPACPLLLKPEAESIAQAVHLPWNLLIAEGLMKYGFRSEAARLLTHNMTAIIQNLKQTRAFHERYHAEKGTGIGERNNLSGLAPVGLFMKILGVEIFSATRVKIEGENPFPWDVTVQYKGMKITRGTDRTEIVFANGKSASVTGTDPHIVEM